MSRADDDVQNWLDGLSFKAKRKLATTIRDEADKLASAIKQAAPVKTGALRDSVQVRRRKNDPASVTTTPAPSSLAGPMRRRNRSSSRPTARWRRKSARTSNLPLRRR
jgi:hypothetical protein